MDKRQMLRPSGANFVYFEQVLISGFISILRRGQPTMQRFQRRKQRKARNEHLHDTDMRRGEVNFRLEIDSHLLQLLNQTITIFNAEPSTDWALVECVNDLEHQRPYAPSEIVCMA